jgi:GNAT superfamily N-acetyltransferase
VIHRSTFAQAAIGEGAAALNRVFEAYRIPITFSSDQLHLHMSYNDVEPGISPLWYDSDGNFLAAALLAIRGTRAWIGGFGVAPPYRERGHAKMLLDSVLETARARGVHAIQLEVLQENMPAFQLYSRSGFQIARTLHSFETTVEEGNRAAGFVMVSAADLIAEADEVQPCWQRERATLRHGAVSTAVSNGKDAYALFRYNAQVAQVLKLKAPNPQTLDTLAAAICENRPFQSVMILNEPEDSAITQYARDAGWLEPFTQYEMLMRLD